MNDGAVTRELPRRVRTVVAVATVFVVVPLLVVIVRLFGARHGALNGDDSLIELRVRDVFSRRTPMLGSYQRYGWNQPGPLYFYVLAIPYRVFGSSFRALQIGAALINLGAILVTVRVVVRRAGALAGFIAILLCTVALHGIALRSASDPWEPNIATLLLVALFAMSMDAALGNRRAWFGSVLLGSLLAQAYASTTIMAVTMVVAGVGLGLWDQRREPGHRTKTAVAVLAVGSLLWLPVVVEQLRHDPGNLTLMARFFRGDHVTLGSASAARALSLEFAYRAPWITHRVPLLPMTTDIDARSMLFPIFFVVLCGCGVLAARRRDRSAIVVVALALVMTLAALMSLRSLVLPLFVWILYPYHAIGIVVLLPVGFLCRALRPARAHAISAVVLLGIVAVGALTIVDSAHVNLAPDAAPAAFERAAASIAAPLNHLHAPVLVSSNVGGQLLSGSGFGRDETAVALIIAGVDVVVAADLANRYGRDRAQPARAQYELRVMDVGAPMPTGFREIAVADPLGARRGPRDALVAELAGRCKMINGTDSPSDQHGVLEWFGSCTRRDAQARAVSQRLEQLPNIARSSLRLGSI